MRVIIAGAGEIGWYIADRVSKDGHDVTIIECDQEKARLAQSNLDAHVITASAASAAVLVGAGVALADLFIAVTGSDDTNLVCASISRKLGAARAVARVDEVVYRKAPEISYRDHFGIDELLSPEMLAALELASVVRNPGSLAVEHFGRGALEMQRMVAGRGAEMVDKPLHELEFPDGVRIASIERGQKFIIPMGDDIVEHGDWVTLIGQTEQVSRYRSCFETEKPKIQKVVIMGGGHTTMSLVRRLRVQMFRLTVIERSSDRCNYLATTLPHATILNGDGTNLAFLKEEQIDNADVFISTTASDEANIMSAIQAKNLGVKKVLVVIHRPDYADLVEKMGIDKAVSPRVVMADNMLSLLRKGKVSTLVTLDYGKAEILELVVECEDFVGKALRNLPLPGGSSVLTLQRGREVTVPHADMEFQLGDTILVICRSEQRKKVIRLIVGST
jgi:trk system potassium uptake protein TrkA